MASSWCAKGFTLPGAASVVAASVVAASVTAGSGAAGVSVEPAVGELQEELRTRVTRLRNDTGLTAVAAAVMIDGQLAGAVVSGERRRDRGVSVTVDDAGTSDRSPSR